MEFHPCLLCKSSFKKNVTLILHMKSQHLKTNQNHYKCELCSYVATYRANIVRHVKMKHAKIKDFKCDECGSTFTAKKSLTQHLAMHEGIKYCCLICKTYETATKDNIRWHLKIKHSDLLGKTIKWDSVKKYVKLK